MATAALGEAEFEGLFNFAGRGIEIDDAADLLQGQVARPRLIPGVDTLGRTPPRGDTAMGSDRLGGRRPGTRTAKEGRAVIDRERGPLESASFIYSFHLLYRF